jgi:hypothetical protein
LLLSSRLGKLDTYANLDANLDRQLARPAFHLAAERGGE